MSNIEKYTLMKQVIASQFHKFIALICSTGDVEIDFTSFILEKKKDDMKFIRRKETGNEEELEYFYIKKIFEEVIYTVDMPSQIYHSATLILKNFIILMENDAFESCPIIKMEIEDKEYTIYDCFSSLEIHDIKKDIISKCIKRIDVLIDYIFPQYHIVELFIGKLDKFDVLKYILETKFKELENSDTTDHDSISQFLLGNELKKNENQSENEIDCRSHFSEYLPSVDNMTNIFTHFSNNTKDRADERETIIQISREVITTFINRVFAYGSVHIIRRIRERMNYLNIQKFDALAKTVFNVFKESVEYFSDDKSIFVKEFLYRFKTLMKNIVGEEYEKGLFDLEVDPQKQNINIVNQNSNKEHGSILENKSFIQHEIRTGGESNYMKSSTIKPVSVKKIDFDSEEESCVKIKCDGWMTTIPKFDIKNEKKNVRMMVIDVCDERREKSIASLVIEASEKYDQIVTFSSSKENARFYNTTLDTDVSLYFDESKQEFINIKHSMFSGGNSLCYLLEQFIDQLEPVPCTTKIFPRILFIIDNISFLKQFDDRYLDRTLKKLIANSQAQRMSIIMGDKKLNSKEEIMTISHMVFIKCAEDENIQKISLHFSIPDSTFKMLMDEFFVRQYALVIDNTRSSFGWRRRINVMRFYPTQNKTKEEVKNELYQHSSGIYGSLSPNDSEEKIRGKIMDLLKKLDENSNGTNESTESFTIGNKDFTLTGIRDSVVSIKEGIEIVLFLNDAQYTLVELFNFLDRVEREHSSTLYNSTFARMTRLIICYFNTILNSKNDEEYEMDWNQYLAHLPFFSKLTSVYRKEIEMIKKDGNSTELAVFFNKTNHFIEKYQLTNTEIFPESVIFEDSNFVDHFKEIIKLIWKNKNKLFIEK